MTVEIDQATLMRNSSGTVTSIGTPSIVPAGAQNIVSSPTPSVMSTPQVNDNIINKKADPAQGLYQTCLTLRERLRDVRDFEQFLEPPEDADPDVPEDPVTQLWRCFRMGSSLCVLFNALQPMELIKDDRLSPHLKTINDCKAATFHFLKGIKNELKIDGEDAFMISNLYSDDTNGFVKVCYSPLSQSGGL
jgi:cell division control protein 24